MKKLTLTIFILLLHTLAYARDPGPGDTWKGINGTVSGRPRTVIVSDDAISFNGNIMSLDVLTTTSANSDWLRLDASNDPVTGDLRLDNGVKLEFDSDTYSLLAGDDLTLYVHGSLRQTWTTAAADGSNIEELLTVSGDAIATDQITANNFSAGTSSPSASFRGEGDIYATSGIKAMEGLYAEASAYGAGVEVLDNDITVTYTNVMYGDATLTASTRLITDNHGSFDSTYIGQYFRVIASTPDFTGATGEIIDVPSSTTLTLSFGTSGNDTIVDATAVKFVIYPAPIFFVGDNGDIHANIGVNENASFKINTDTSANEHAVHFVSTAIVDGNAGLEIEFDPSTFSDGSALEIDFDATGFVSPDTIGTVVDVIIDNANGASDGEVHAIDVAVSDSSNIDLKISALATHSGVDVIHQHTGAIQVFPTAFKYDNSAGTYTDVALALSSDTVDVDLFDEDNDRLYVGALTKFDSVEVILGTDGDPTIRPLFGYVEDDGTETGFSPGDDTDGFQGSGLIRFDSDSLSSWGQRTIAEITGSGDNAVDYYWLYIQRRKNNMVTLPTEDVITYIVVGEYGWDKEGALSVDSVAVTDAIAEPGTVSGFAVIFVDTSDGDLKVKFGNGFVATIVADS